MNVSRSGSPWGRRRPRSFSWNSDISLLGLARLFNNVSSMCLFVVERDIRDLEDSLGITVYISLLGWVSLFFPLVRSSHHFLNFHGFCYWGCRSICSNICFQLEIKKLMSYFNDDDDIELAAHGSGPCCVIYPIPPILEY